MRAIEFLSEDRPLFILAPDFIDDFNGLKMHVFKGEDGFTVKVYDPKVSNMLGYIEFSYIGYGETKLHPEDFSVADEYQRQGIGKALYDYVKLLGYKIFKSKDQTLPGRKFWSKHRGRKTVWEAINIKVDVPNEKWLQDQIDYAKSKPRDSFGVPYMGKITASSYGVKVPVALLKTIPGMRGEQYNVRRDDLAAITKIMKDTNELPLTQSGKPYLPFVVIAYDGSAWVNEGNHRIMAAVALGLKELPIEIRYFDGGERVKDGQMYPGNL